MSCQESCANQLMFRKRKSRFHSEQKVINLTAGNSPNLLTFNSLPNSADNYIYPVISPLGKLQQEKQEKINRIK